MIGLPTPAQLLQLERSANDVTGNAYLDRDEVVNDLLAENEARMRAIMSAQTFDEELRFVYSIRDESVPMWKRQARQWERLWSSFDKAIVDHKEREKVCWAAPLQSRLHAMMTVVQIGRSGLKRVRPQFDLLAVSLRGGFCSSVANSSA